MCVGRAPPTPWILVKPFWLIKAGVAMGMTWLASHDADTHARPWPRVRGGAIVPFFGYVNRERDKGNVFPFWEDVFVPMSFTVD